MPENKTVAYLGPEASYTHQATRAFFSNKNYTLTPQSTIPAIFSAVQAGQASYGLVPFYNSTYGAVIATLDAFATALVPSLPFALPSETRTGNPVPEAVSSSSRTDGDARYPDVRIHGAIELPIKHCLLGHKDSTPAANSANDAAQWARIKRVYSHEQALGQCAGFLTAHMPHAERISVPSTSAAAQLVANAKTDSGAADTSVAAISSEMAADMYTLGLLQRDIQDHDDNSTRFFVLATGPREDDDNDDAPHIEALQGSGGNSTSKQMQTRTSLLAFTVAHSAPGALARSLASLEKHELNAVGIQQRPPDRLRKEDAIFVEVEGPAKGVEAALEELQRSVAACVCLGWWWGGWL